MATKVTKPVGEDIEHNSRKYRILVEYDPNDGGRTFVEGYPKNSETVEFVQMSIHEFKQFLEEEKAENKLSEEQEEFLYESKRTNENILRKCLSF